MCGEDALRNVSSGVTGNLKEEWVREHREWCRTDPGAEDWLCVWADAVCLSVRGSERKQCFLAIVGCNARGERRLQALETAASEHNENWKALLDGLHPRGLCLHPGAKMCAEDSWGSDIAAAALLHLAAATPERMLPDIPGLSGHVAPRLDPGALVRKNGRIVPPEGPARAPSPTWACLAGPRPPTTGTLA